MLLNLNCFIQYNDAFLPKRLRNWCDHTNPHNKCCHPRACQFRPKGHLDFLCDDRGHLLPCVKQCITKKPNHWGLPVIRVWDIDPYEGKCDCMPMTEPMQMIRVCTNTTNYTKTVDEDRLESSADEETTTFTSDSDESITTDPETEAFTETDPNTSTDLTTSTDPNTSTNDSGTTEQKTTDLDTSDTDSDSDTELDADNSSSAKTPDRRNSPQQNTKQKGFRESRNRNDGKDYFKPKVNK